MHLDLLVERGVIAERELDIGSEELSNAVVAVSWVSWVPVSTVVTALVVVLVNVD